jgi:CheY-like chemotaxis protein
MKILLAEDSTVTAMLMTGILTRHGYTVVLARNGSEALSLLASDPDIQGVITDIMMPESSGLDLLRAMKAHPSWKNLPTIVTTARDDRATVAEAVALGCHEYVLKPVRPASLIERVTKVFPPEKVILMGSAEVISRYSLTAEKYGSIAKSFAIEVDHTISALQRRSMSDPNARRVDLIPIMEGATLLGAERLAAALEETTPSTEASSLNPLQVANLEKELQLVRTALRSQMG